MVNEKERSIGGFVEEYYVPQVVEGILNIEDSALEKLTDKVLQRIKEGRRIFAFGNGGSEAIAEAFIHCLEQETDLEYQFDTYANPKARGIAESKNSTMFNFPIRRSGRAGDLALLVSASGNSENINNVSVVCRELGVETVSISGNGRIANDVRTKSDYPVVIPIEDQQIQEDVTLGALYLIAEMVNHKLQGNEEPTDEVKRDYVVRLRNELRGISVTEVNNLALDILKAYQEGKTVRIDAPENGLLVTNAEHMAHNLKWDAFQDVPQRISNKVYAGLLTPHITGVSNDGGESFNYAVEVDDNCEDGDVEVVLTYNVDHKAVKRLSKTAKDKGVRVYQFNFGEHHAGSNVAQIMLHLVGRVLNTYLLLGEGNDPTDFQDRLHTDLAMLRKKDETKAKLRETYKNGL